MMKWRILAAVASVILGAFSLGGYVAWTIADYYGISDQVDFVFVLATSILFLLLALYWTFFAIVGHRTMPVRANRILFCLSVLLGIPGCLFVLVFFL